MINRIRHNSQALKYISVGILAAVGGVLATPLVAGPLVLLALIATVLMLTKGRKTWQGLGQQTVDARYVLMVAFGGWFFAELLSTAINNQHWQNLDYPLRFLLAIGVFWIIRYAEIRRSEMLYFGIVASAISAAGISFYQFTVVGEMRTFGWTNYPIYFGNLCVLLCVYAVIVLFTDRSNMSPKLRASISIAIPLLIMASFFSGSRSSWLGLAALLLLVDWRRANRMRLFASGLTIVVLLVVLLIFVPELVVNLRISEAAHDFHAMFNGDFNTSIGYRVQMWKAALIMFWSSPLIGIGSNEYQAALTNLVANGAIQAEFNRSEDVFNQAHSEIMDALATKGLVGLGAYLALLILPYRFFQKIAETTAAEARTFALLGQATIITFVMFGLTLATFKIQIYCAVFPAAIAVFAAMALNFAERNKSRENAHG